MIELCFLAYILFDPGKKFLSCDPACKERKDWRVVTGDFVPLLRVQCIPQA